MKNFKNHLRFNLLLTLIIIGVTYSCSDDEVIESKKEYLITQVSTIDATQPDFDGVDNIWDYEYDENEKLISVTQYNPRNIDSKSEYRLIYDSKGELIMIKPITDKPLHYYEYEITHEEGKVSLYNFGADIKNYYYNSDGFITKTEDVFIGYNTNFRNYILNSNDQLVKVEGGVDGEVRHTALYSDFDNDKPFQFHYVFPTQDFIIMYAFNLKYNGLGKPSSWDYGYYEYEADSNGNVSEMKIFSDINNVREYEEGMRFKYKEKK
ncbi:hypothetical protein [Lutibacter sp.]